mgnify:CR=1 FL=1
MLENLRNKMQEQMYAKIASLTKQLESEKVARQSRVEDIQEFEF